MQPSTPLTAQALAFVPTVTSRIGESLPSTLTRKEVEEEQKGSYSATQRSADEEEAGALLSSSATPHPFEGQEDTEDGGDSSSYNSQRDAEGWVVTSRGNDVLAPLLAQYPELKRNYMLPSLEELELKRRLQQGVARVTVDDILERYRRIRLVRAHRERCLREMRMENLHEEFGFDDDDYPFWRPLVTYADLPRSVRQLIFEFMPAISTPFELDLQYLIRVLQVNNASAVRNPEEAMQIVKAVEQNLVTHKHMYGKFSVLAWALGIPTISKNTYGQQVQKLEEETPYALLTMAGGVGTVADDVRYGNGNGNGNEKGGRNTTTIKFLSPRLVLKELAQRKRIEEEARQLTLAHHRREQQLDLFREGVVLLNPATKARQLGEGRRRQNDKNNRSNNNNNKNTLLGDVNGEDEARSEANRASAAIDKLLMSISADEGEEDTERFTGTSQQGVTRRRRASSVFSTSSTAVSSSTANGGGGRTVVVEEGPPSALVALATAAFELKEEAQRKGGAFAANDADNAGDSLVRDSGVDTVDHSYSRAGLVRSPVPAAGSAQLQESPAEYGEPNYMSSSPLPLHQEAKTKEYGPGLPLSPLTIRAHTSSSLPPTSRRGERSLSGAHDSGATPANLPSPSSAAAGSGASLALAVRRRVSVMDKALDESSSMPTAGAGVILSPGRRYPNPQHHQQSSSLKKESSVLSSVAASTSVILYDARLMRSALDKHPQRQRVRSMLNLTTQLIRRLYDKINKYKQWRDFREKVFSTTCKNLRPNLRQAIAEWEAQLLAWRKERCVVVVELPTLEEQKKMKRRARAKDKKVVVMVALSTDGDDGYDYDEDTPLATDGSPRTHTKGPQTITVDNKDVVSEVALQELYYIKRRLGAVEFIGDPKIEMDDIKAMFRACGIDSSVVPSEDRNYALASATMNDANRTDRGTNGLDSSTLYPSPNPNVSSSSLSYSAFVVPMVTEASYASTLTFSQCSTLGLLDVPWVNGYAWQDKEGELISEETPEARRARGEAVSYDQTRIGSLYPPRAVGTGGASTMLVKTLKNEMEATPNAPKELVKFVNKVEPDNGSSSSSSSSRSSSPSRSMLGDHTRDTSAMRHDGVTPPKKMSALEKVSALMSLRSQKRAGIDTSSVTKSKTKGDTREQQGENKNPSSVASSREREGKKHSSREGHLKAKSEVLTSLTPPAVESAFTYTVGLVDEESDEGKREAAARAAVAEKARLLRARDVAVTAMSQRVWRPHLAFKPRRYHAFGGCELCSDPLVIHLGMAKPGGGACGDIVVCGPCYLECFSIGDDNNTKRAVAESASKTNAPLAGGGGNEAPPFLSPAEIERRRKENRHIHAMYDWYFIRDLVGLGRDGDANASTVVSSSTAAGLFPSHTTSAPSVSLSVSSQQSPTSWIPTGIMRRGVGVETGGIKKQQAGEDDNAYSSGRETPLVVLMPSTAAKANSLARSCSAEEKNNAADELISPCAAKYRQERDAEATEEGNDDVPPPASLSSTQNGTNRL